MANTNTAKRGSLGKKLGIALGVILLLTVVLYFVVTSTAFFKGFILPRVSKEVGADVTVADASISPFSKVALQKVKVQKPGEDPMLLADEVVARYSLMDIIKGNINVHEVTVVSPVIRLVEQADAKKEEPAKDTSKPGAKDEETPKVNIRNVTIKNGTVQLVKKHEDGGEELTELSNLNLNLDQIQNGASSKLELSSGVRLQSPGTNAVPNLLAGNMNGTFNFTLNQKLMPENAKGSAQFIANDVSGDYADLAGLTTKLNTDLSPTQIQDLSVEFSRKGQRLGQIRANGPFDTTKQEGKLNVIMDSIDHNVLNIFGAPKGIDFGKTEINSTNTVELSKAGEFVSVQGQLRIDSFSITQTNQTTPAVDLIALYNVTVDQPNSTAVIKTFTLNGTQNKKPLLAGSLSRPMQLNWGATNGAVDESAFALTVTNLNLADWRAFAADLNPAGTAALQLNAVSQKAGSQIQFDVNSRLQNFSAQLDTNKIEKADITLMARGQIAELKNLNLTESRVELAQGGERAATVTAAGTYGVESGDADLKATLDAALPKLFELVKIADSKAATGKVTFNGQIKQAKNQQTVVGNFAVENFNGNYGEYLFKNYYVTSEADIQNNENSLEIRKMITSLRQATAEGGTIQVTGNMNPKTSIGSFEVKLNGLNEAGVRPFVQPSLGERRLRSILLNGNVTAKINSTNSYAIQSDIKVGDLLIIEPNQTNTPSPLAARLKADVTMEGPAVQLRTVTADIDYGGKPAGQFDVAGNYNTETGRGKLDLKLAGLNQNAVRTFMPQLGGKDLVTISINGSASANLESADNQAIKADFKIADLVVRDPKKAEPDAPLSAQLQLDAAMTKALVELRQFQLNLSPTDRAKNQLLIKGRLDRSNTNAYNGDLAITSDSFDVTKFYDLYIGVDSTPQSKPGATPSPTPTQPAAPAGDANQESEPMKLPVGKITLAVNIGQFYLREIAVSHLVAKGSVVTNRITLSPMQMSMNGAPMKADVDLDLGVRGYAYNISFAADHVPLKPVVNTFMPENHDQYQGDIVANGQIRGVGTTGVSLRQHLDGQIGFTFTNANIKFGRKIQPFLVAIATVTRTPEIAQSPIDWVSSDLQFRNGQIQIPRFMLKSEAIRCSTQGTIPIADVLTNSPLNLPVKVELRRSYADKLFKEMFVEDTRPESKFREMQPFLNAGGTLGEPKADVKAALQSAASALIKNKVQDLIGGPKPAPTNAPPQQPRQPGATNQAPANSIIKGIFDSLNTPK